MPRLEPQPLGDGNVDVEEDKRLSLKAFIKKIKAYGIHYVSSINFPEIIHHILICRRHDQHRSRELCTLVKVLHKILKEYEMPGWMVDVAKHLSQRALESYDVKLIKELIAKQFFQIELLSAGRVIFDREMASHFVSADSYQLIAASIDHFARKYMDFIYGLKDSRFWGNNWYIDIKQRRAAKKVLLLLFLHSILTSTDNPLQLPVFARLRSQIKLSWFQLIYVMNAPPKPTYIPSRQLFIFLLIACVRHQLSDYVQEMYTIIKLRYDTLLTPRVRSWLLLHAFLLPDDVPLKSELIEKSKEPRHSQLAHAPVLWLKNGFKSGLVALLESDLVERFDFFATDECGDSVFSLLIKPEDHPLAAQCLATITQHSKGLSHELLHIMLEHHCATFIAHLLATSICYEGPDVKYTLIVALIDRKEFDVAEKLIAQNDVFAKNKKAAPYLKKSILKTLNAAKNVTLVKRVVIAGKWTKGTKEETHMRPKPNHLKQLSTRRRPR